MLIEITLECLFKHSRDKNMSNQSHKLGRWQGAALLATTLLGTSVFILPQITISIAGSGALVTWLLLTLAIIPVALVFGRLASVFPHAAGPAYFVEKAFGMVAGRTVGLIFLLIVPIGAPAAILMTFQFIDALIMMPEQYQLITQLGMLFFIFLLNVRGIQISANLQLILTFAIVAVVIVLLGNLSINLDAAKIESVTKNSIEFNSVITAAGIAFWSFLGIEAMAHLASDFQDPKKDLTPAIMIGTILVGLIYLACTLLQVVIPTSSESAMPKLAMIAVFDQLMGNTFADISNNTGALIIGVLGIAGGIATVNVYTASLARLAWSFSNDGVLPKYLFF